VPEAPVNVIILPARELSSIKFPDAAYGNPPKKAVVLELLLEVEVDVTVNGEYAELKAAS
jgi:hypothetical protein